MKPEVLLFDLGGVLVDFVGPERLSNMLNGRFSLHQVRQLWPKSPSLTKFELGKVSPEVFAEDFTSEWSLSISPEDFLKEFSTWSRAPLSGALSLLDELQDVATLACLTNMNSAYWERVRDEMGFGSKLDRCYASHEIGLLKPDPKVYEYVISDLSCEPAEVLFFDDTKKNVDAAEALGIRAYQTQGIIELKATIDRVLNEISP